MYTQMPISKDMHILQHKLIDLIQYITIILYIAIAFGLSTLAPGYLDYLQKYLKIYISCFLIYRFNMFRTIQFTDLDRKIAFSAGLFILTTTTLNEYLLDFEKKFRQYFNL